MLGSTSPGQNHWLAAAKSVSSSEDDRDEASNEDKLHGDTLHLRPGGFVSSTVGGQGDGVEEVLRGCRAWEARSRRCRVTAWGGAFAGPVSYRVAV